VPPAPRLALTRFLAFGDSLTVGIVSQPAPTFALTATLGYPEILQGLLSQRYTSQPITTFNEGKAGEWATEGATRLPGVLRARDPDVVFLMEGDNDLNALGERGIRSAAAAVESMAKEARFQGARVFIATLPPQRADGIRAESSGLVVRYNRELVAVARGELATLVDVYASFGNDASLIGPDGLHPTEAGYRRIAETFFASVRSSLEVPAARSLGE
jgi:lysophospholipase L1-like esterase